MAVGDGLRAAEDADHHHRRLARRCGLVRPKRQYAAPLPKPSRGPRWGWRGFSTYLWLLIAFGSPEGFMLWRWSLANDGAVFALLCSGYAICFGIFCVIARPVSGRGLET